MISTADCLANSVGLAPQLYEFKLKIGLWVGRMLDFGTLPSAISLIKLLFLWILRFSENLVPKSSPICAWIVLGCGPLPLLWRLPFSPPPKFAPPAPVSTGNRKTLPGWPKFTPARSRKSNGAGFPPACNHTAIAQAFAMVGVSFTGDNVIYLPRTGKPVAPVGEG